MRQRRSDGATIPKREGEGPKEKTFPHCTRQARLVGCAGHGRLPLFYRENNGGKAYLVFPIIYNKIYFVFAFLQETSLVPLVDGNTLPLPTIDRHRPLPLLLPPYRKLYRGSFMHQQEKQNKTEHQKKKDRRTYRYLRIRYLTISSQTFRRRGRETAFGSG